MQDLVGDSGLTSAVADQAPGTFPDALQRNALLRPEMAAIVAPGRPPLSHFELARTVEEIGFELRRRGVGRETRVGIALPTGPEAAVAIIALSCHAVAVPLNPDAVEAELEERSRALRLDAVAVLDGTRTTAEAVAQRRGIAVLKLSRRGPAAGSLALTAGMADVAVDASDAKPGDIAFILNTSGTTAQPKIVPVTHANLTAIAVKFRGWFGLSPEDRSLCLIPLYYAQGLKQSIFVPILCGGSVAASDNPASHHDFLDRLSELAPTWYSAGPTHQRWILELAQKKPGLRHSLRFIQSGGAHLAEPVRLGLEQAFGVPVLEAYGLAEAGLMATNQMSPAMRRPGTVGAVSPSEVMVAGIGGERLAAGSVGEVLVGGPTVTPGYLDNPQANREAFVAGGWFRTGDLGAIDEDGFLSLLGRVKELINRGGEKVSPVEIDQALMRHPAVVEAAAFGVPHPRLGENVAAAVVLRAGNTTGPAELRRFLRDRLTPFKIPHRIVIVDALPKDGVGKVQRTRLRDALPESAAAPLSPGDLDYAVGPLEVDLIKIWETLLNCDGVGFEDDFFEKGGDSLLATQMLLEVERLTGRAVPDSILFDAPTVRQLARAVAVPDPIEAKPLIRVQSGGDAPPLFFFHGDLHNGGYYTQRLAALLGPAQPLVAVNPTKLDPDFRLPSIKEMAAQYRSALIAEFPSGPFRLGGFCNGALVAFETARLLKRSGREVELVAMIDAPMFDTRPLARRLDAFVSASPLRRTRYGALLEKRLAPVIARVRRHRGAARRRVASGGKFAEAAPGTGGNPAEFGEADRRAALVEARWSRVVHNHVPKPAPVPVVYFSAINDGAPWRRFSRDIEIVTMDCGHLGCVTTHLEILAGHLRRRLETSAGG